MKLMDKEARKAFEDSMNVKQSLVVMLVGATAGFFASTAARRVVIEGLAKVAESKALEQIAAE